MLTPRWFPLRPHPEQERLRNSTKRFRVVAAGRSSGKTELAKRWVVERFLTPRPVRRALFFVAGPTFGWTFRVYWDDLVALCPKEYLVEDPGVSGVIKTRWGSELHIASLDNPIRIEGSQWFAGVVDESSDIKPGAWSRSIRPALAEYIGECWRIGVPKRAGWGVQEFREVFEKAKLGLLPDTDAFWWASKDILTPEEIFAAQEELSTEDFAEQFEAKWMDSQGALFTSFSRDMSVHPLSYDVSRTIFVGADFNVDPMCWVLAHWDGRELNVFDEVHLHNTNTQDTLSALSSRYTSHKGGWFFTGDATSKARKTSAHSSDYALICGDTRFKPKLVRFGDSNPSISDRLAATNRLLRDATDRRRLYVAPHCKRLIADLQYQTDVQGIGDTGHMSAALGYLVWALAPLKVSLLSTSVGRVVVRKKELVYGK